MIKDNGFSCKPEFRAFSGYPIIKSSLDAGNIDVFAMDRSTLAGYMNETVELLQPEVKFGEQGYGVATKKGCDLSAVVDQVICDRLADGWLDQEVKTWGLYRRIVQGRNQMLEGLFDADRWSTTFQNMGPFWGALA